MAHHHNRLQNALIGSLAIVIGSSHFVAGAHNPGPVTKAVVSIATGDTLVRAAIGPTGLMTQVGGALEAFKTSVGPLSHSLALEEAFRSYFAFKSAHPGEVRKPLLYFVDYGLPSTTPRGYVFDMSSLRIVDGPFTVAHGRGSSTSQYGVPTRFSNSSGAQTSSLGLYVAANTYDFHGKSGGQRYSSVGLKLMGVSTGFNDNAYARGVVAHGAPYVTATRAGRSEGCPAMEEGRAARLLPALANGGMVFLFAPESNWMQRDPWLAASGQAPVTVASDSAQKANSGS